MRSTSPENRAHACRSPGRADSRALPSLLWRDRVVVRNCYRRQAAESPEAEAWAKSPAREPTRSPPTRDVLRHRLRDSPSHRREPLRSRATFRALMEESGEAPPPWTREPTRPRPCAKMEPRASAARSRQAQAVPAQRKVAPPGLRVFRWQRSRVQPPDDRSSRATHVSRVWDRS